MQAPAGSQEQTAGDLLGALTTLASSVKPVTVQSLKWWDGDRKRDLTIPSVVIGISILIFSLLTFVSGNISAKLTSDIDAANALVLKLRVELGPSDEVLTNAQEGTANVTGTQNQIWFGAQQEFRLDCPTGM